MVKRHDADTRTAHGADLTIAPGRTVLVLNILNSMSFPASNDGISCEFYYQNSDFCKLFGAHPLVF